MASHRRNITTDGVDDHANFSWLDLFRAVWFFLRDLRFVYTLNLVLLAFLYLYDFVPAYVFGRLVDFFTHYEPGMSLALPYEFAVFLGVSWMAVGHMRLITKNQLGNLAIEAQYRAKVEGFQRLMDYSLTWHQTENTGNKIQRITNGVTYLRNFMVLLSKEILFSLAAIPSVILIFGHFGLDYLLLVSLYIVAFFSTEWYFQSRIQRANNAYNRSLEQSSGAYFESANNVMTIKSLGVKEKVKAGVASREGDARNHNISVRQIGTLKWRIFQTINGLTIFVFVLMITHNAAIGTLTAGTIFTLYTYLMRLSKTAGDTGEMIMDALDAKSAVGRMMPIFLGDTATASGTKPFPKDWAAITINHGSFRYAASGESFALADVNLSVKRGEKLGVVGKSGSGKSTLAKLLLGLYTLDQGEFTIGHTPYAEISHEHVTQHISTVLQETELFNLSLRENLTLFKRVPAELVAKAVHIAKLDEVIAALPQGLDTLIGEKGYKLSGGERQRVGIARAICSNAEILVFDEATSALDSKTESIIQARLEIELDQKTMIIIAHRLSTLKNVDRIVVFDHGTIVEEGNFKELLKNARSRFARMYTLQHKQAKDAVGAAA